MMVGHVKTVKNQYLGGGFILEAITRLQLCPWLQRTGRHCSSPEASQRENAMTHTHSVAATDHVRAAPRPVCLVPAHPPAAARGGRHPGAGRRAVPPARGMARRAAAAPRRAALAPVHLPVPQCGVAGGGCPAGEVRPSPEVIYPLKPRAGVCLQPITSY